MEHSVSSRSPSGQWYPQQSQPPAFLGYSPQQQQQWNQMTSTTTAMSGGHPATVPASAGFATSGAPGMLANSSTSLWGQQQSNFGMSPQQMMMMHGVYAPQEPCCGPCCGSTQGWCGSPQDSCCGSEQGNCCQRPGEPIDPFCCSPTLPGEEPCCCGGSCGCFDWSLFASCVLCVLTIAGFAVVIGTQGQDDIFSTFDVRDTQALSTTIEQYIRRNITRILTGGSPYAPPGCTPRKLFGSFGTLCMEGNLNANVFAVQLSFWTNGRNSLWLLATVYSMFTFVYALLIQLHRRSSATKTADRNGLSAALPSIPPEQQEEFMKMTPQQQQAFIREFQKQLGPAHPQSPSDASQPHKPPSDGCFGPDNSFGLYDTPFYEFVRIAWFVSGITAFLWTCNIFLSFWSFSGFYEKHTTGPLNAFWVAYARKMNISLILVTILLAWPLVNFFLELVVWVALFFPWLVIRSTCKQGIGMYRPALPLSQLPAYIRADMFFMDFQDVKRLGFSRQAWMILTGSDTPFLNCCEDPNVDRDPAMTKLMQQRMQWQQMMMMIPPWMQSQYAPMMGPGGAGMMTMMPGGQVAPSPQHSQLGTGMVATQETATHYPAEDGGSKSHRRRRHRSTRDHRHADPLETTPVEQTSVRHGATGRDDSSRHRRRSRSRSRSRRRSKAAFDGGLPQQPGSDAAVSSSAIPPAENGYRRRHRRSHSRSFSKEMASMQTSPTAAQRAPAEGGESVSEGHRRQRRSEEKVHVSAAAAAAAPAADLDALMEL